MSELPKAKIVAHIGRTDAGEHHTACPHCGAEGRYVYRFICDDGVERGAMSGCVKLFRTDNSRLAKLTRTAYDKAALAKDEKRQPASWWREIIAATERFGRGEIDRVGLTNLVMGQEARRQEWLQRNGYGRRR